MKINVSALKKQLGSSIAFNFVAFPDMLALSQDTSWVTGDIRVEGEVVNNGENFGVKGRIRLRVVLQCSRCLKDFFQELDIMFDESYSEKLNNNYEVGENYLVGDELELTQLLQANIYFAEPLKPLCSEQCQGICSECGANLNETLCGCNRENLDPRFAALKKLLNND